MGDVQLIGASVTALLQVPFAVLLAREGEPPDAKAVADLIVISTRRLRCSARKRDAENFAD